VSAFHKILRYFIHEPEELERRPRQFINPYEIREATDDQLLMMKAVKARSPEEAQRLMELHKAANIYELLAKLERQKPSFWQRIKARAVTLVMRIEGASVENPVYRKSKSDRMEIEYKWEE
jgi:hypothetical protein